MQPPQRVPIEQINQYETVATSNSNALHSRWAQTLDLSGREVRAAQERAGLVFRRQSGSHMILRRDEPHARVVIPDHKQVRAGTLRHIVADAGMTVDQFIQLLMRRGDADKSP